MTMECMLLMPECLLTALSYQNAFGITVQSFLTNTYKKLKVVIVPQYQGTGSPIGSSALSFGRLFSLFSSGLF